MLDVVPRSAGMPTRMTTWGSDVMSSSITSGYLTYSRPCRRCEFTQSFGPVHWVGGHRMLNSSAESDRMRIGTVSYSRIRSKDLSQVGGSLCCVKSALSTLGS